MSREVDHMTESTITVRKCRIDPDQRMNAKALLLAHFPSLLNGGQLIVHFSPGRTPVWVEIQERVDVLPKQQVGLVKVS